LQKVASSYLVAVQGQSSKALTHRAGATERESRRPSIRGHTS
jgi:hypothetical protein